MKERQELFIKEFKELLAKHNATFFLKDTGTDYSPWQTPMVRLNDTSETINLEEEL